MNVLGVPLRRDGLCDRDDRNRWGVLVIDVVRHDECRPLAGLRRPARLAEIDHVDLAPAREGVREDGHTPPPTATRAAARESAPLEPRARARASLLQARDIPRPSASP